MVKYTQRALRQMARRVIQERKKDTRLYYKFCGSMMRKTGLSFGKIDERIDLLAAGCL